MSRTVLQQARAAAEPFPGEPWGLAVAHRLLSDTLLRPTCWSKPQR